MNRFYKKAQDYIKEEIGEDFTIIENSIKDFSDLYGFLYQHRKYLETGDFKHLYVGNGYTFISKSDDRIFTHGSGKEFDSALRELRHKIRQEVEIRKVKTEFNIQKQYNLKINSIAKKQLLIDTILPYNFTYIIPEVVGSSIFRIKQIYNKKMLKEKLIKLPITFHGVDQDTITNLLSKIIKGDLCTFDIIEQESNSFKNHVDIASAEDLEAIW